MCSLAELKKEYLNIPDGIWDMVDNLDAFTFNHSLRVCEMCQIVEKALNLPGTVFSEAGLLHDIGKYYISREILQKRGSLTEDERDFINMHAFLSYDILTRFHLPETVCKITLYHHSLKPELYHNKLPECKDKVLQQLALRMKTIDIFEAITSDRPYHRGMCVASAVKFFENVEHDKDVLNILVNSRGLNRD